MLVKEHVIAAVREMPPSFSVEELLDQVLLLEKIELGMQQSRAGQVYDIAQAKERLAKWLQ